ncbi:DUF4397 domain-containing protein [Natrinema amylolyticum]|uniref:DUF4397 domain-containing protein n=1 Tax=Natrinema amylolyticum TaxID=2878679 RepID=UPI001CF9DA84|nr:DUF4397 domain-containing protein [Natrinema amylolyticum]
MTAVDDGALTDRKGTEESIEAETATLQNDEEFEETNASRVRIAHLSPVFPAMTVTVDSESIARNLSFGEVSDYEVVEPEEQEFEITINETGEELEVSQTLEPNTTYTFLAVANVTENETVQFEPLLLRDEFAPPSETDASVRFVHASPDMPAVDITVAETNITVANNVSFREDSDYVALPAADIPLEIRQEADNDSGEVLDRVNVSLDNGTVHSIAAVGYLNPEAAPIDAPLNVGLFQDARLETNGDDPVTDSADAEPNEENTNTTSPMIAVADAVTDVEDATEDVRDSIEDAGQANETEDRAAAFDDVEDDLGEMERARLDLESGVENASNATLSDEAEIALDAADDAQDDTEDAIDDVQDLLEEDVRDVEDADVDEVAAILNMTLEQVTTAIDEIDEVANSEAAENEIEGNS